LSGRPIARQYLVRGGGWWGALRRPATGRRWVITEREGLIMSGKRILLVEDNAVNRRLAQFLLKSKGYEVWEVASVPEAFATLKERRPDLILMDIQLPEVDGLTATRHLKADPATRDIPVVAVTSYAMKGDEAKALEAGCSGYVTKPIDKTQFLDTVARLLPQPKVSG
jgi:CheY-like chemotaxis protein